MGELLTVVTRKGQITVPAEIRRGSVSLMDSWVQMEPPSDPASPGLIDKTAQLLLHWPLSVSTESAVAYARLYAVCAARHVIVFAEGTVPCARGLL